MLTTKMEKQKVSQEATLTKLKEKTRQRAKGLGKYTIMLSLYITMYSIFSSNASPV